MGLEVGSILEGRVSAITGFGAFVALPEGKSGLVHISEIANSYVSDVHEHLQLGQTVKVRVLGVSPEGKIKLSIKRAREDAPAPRRGPVPGSGQGAGRQARAAADPPGGDRDFEDRLKKFMQESDSRIADTRRHSEFRQRNRRR